MKSVYSTLAGRIRTNPGAGTLYLGLEIQDYPGGNVQVSKDGGTTWSGLGGFDGNATIWFNSGWTDYHYAAWRHALGGKINFAR